MAEAAVHTEQMEIIAGLREQLNTAQAEVEEARRQRDVSNEYANRVSGRLIYHARALAASLAGKKPKPGYEEQRMQRVVGALQELTHQMRTACEDPPTVGTLCDRMEEWLERAVAMLDGDE